MRAALVSLLLTWCFFCEYIPPAKRVHLWSDIEGYHYPLLDYAHKSLWQGRLPLWDPSIYCGIPFAGNVQAGLFYPPNWLLFLANAPIPAFFGGSAQSAAGVRMRFTSIEILAILHAWLAFLFSYFWLRERTAEWLPAALGGTTVACGGYMLSQMNHLGVICGFAWMPLALWGIEQSNSSGSWRPMWKVAVAGSLCLLAGYPPTLVGLGFVCLTYAAALRTRTRLIPLTAAVLAFSAVLGAVQLLPALDATAMKHSDAAFGAALPFGNGFYGSMLLPNWFDQNRTNSGPEAADGDYMYLGVPFLFGLIWLARRGRFHGAGPALFLLCLTFFFAADPTGVVLRTIEHIPFLMDVLRRYNFLPGAVLAAALLGASAVDDFLIRGAGRPLPTLVRFGWAGGMLAWMTYLLTTNRFGTAFASAIYPAITLTLLAAGLFVYRSDRRAEWVAVILALGVLAEFQAFGTNRRFNAVDGDADSFWAGDARLGGSSVKGLDDAAYTEILRHPGFRVGLYEGPHVTDLRHYGLASLQGFDPILTKQYRASVEHFGPWKTNRVFDINPLDEPMLRQFGVRWIFVCDGTPMQRQLDSDARFRKLPPGTSFFVAFEYLDAKPAWRFEAGSADLTRWDAEHRLFNVTSSGGGPFVLVEQFFPGWKATVDGKEATIQRVDGAFQGIAVPAGRHSVQFRYVPDSLLFGAAISLFGIATLGYLLTRHRPSLTPGARDQVVSATV